MVTTPANTSPLERSYAKLQLVAAKRRNHFTSENLEVLYLLAAINHLCLPLGATEYDAEIKKLMRFIDIFTPFRLLCWKKSSRGVLMKTCSDRYKFTAGCPCMVAFSKSRFINGVLLGICCIFLNTLS